MATHSGTLFTGGIVTDKVAWWTAPPVIIDNNPLVVGAFGNGPVTSNIPNGRKKHNGTASAYPGTFETYFNRPILTPSTIRAGAIVSDLIYQVDVYLAYNDRAHATAEAPIISDATLTLSGPEPGIYPNGSTLRYSLHIESDAETAAVDDVIYYPVVDSPSGELVVTGTRTLVWRYAAQEGATETFEFNTSIAESYTSEQRTRLATNPIQKYRYNMRLTQAEREEIAHLAREGIKSKWAFPLWHEARPIAGDVIQGQMILDLDTTNTTMNLSDSIAIYKSGVVEITKVNTVTDTQIILSTPILTDFGRGTIAMPARDGIIQDGIDLSITDGLQGSLDVEFTIDNDPTINTKEDAPNVHQNMEVLHKPTLVGVKQKFKQEFEQFHNGIARPLQYLKRSQSDKTIEIKWEMRTPADRYYVRALVDRLAGQYTPAWIPTFRHDIKAVEQLKALSNSIKCNIPDLEKYEPIKAIAITVLSTGESLFFEVYSILDIGGGEYALNTVETFQTDYNASDIMISFMKQYRATSDTAQIRHYRSRSEITLTMKEVDEQ